MALCSQGAHSHPSAPHLCFFGNTGTHRGRALCLHTSKVCGCAGCTLHGYGTRIFLFNEFLWKVAKLQLFSWGPAEDTSQRQQWREAARHPAPGILSSALLCDSAIIGNIIKFSSGLLTCAKAERMRVETESDFLSYVQTIQICILKKNVCGIARLRYFKKTHNRK